MWFERVPDHVQIVRAEFVEELLVAGIEINKANRWRAWLENRMGIPLLSDDKLLRQYLGPLQVMEFDKPLQEFKDEFISV